MDAHHGQTAPAETIVAWSAHVPDGAAVLDVAAGSGRHARWFAERGCRVTAVDRDVDALHALGDARIEVVEADLEDAPWPFADRAWDAVVVVNYLWRPLLPKLVAALADGGHLLYETFMAGNERYGRPRNPDFLLREGELQQLAEAHDLDVVAFSEGPVGEPPTAMRQRLCARRRPVA